jgi:hypothetical protein
MWLLIPTSASSPALALSTSRYELLCHDLAVSVMSRSTAKQSSYWRRELKKGVLTRRLPGLTFEPSHATSIVAAWLELWRVSPARIIRLQESALASSESTVNSGITSPQPFASWDRTGCCWRTFQESLFRTEQTTAPFYQQDSGLFLETWPTSGSMLDGCVYQHPTSELRTAAPDGSAWPTARAEDAESCGNHPRGESYSLTGATGNWASPDANQSSYSNGRFGPNLREQPSQWQTPATDSFRSRGGDRVNEMRLDQQSRFWPTPNAHDGRRPGVDDKSTQGANIQRDAAAWGTPRVTTNGGNPTIHTGRGLRIEDQAAMWGTPTSRDHKDGSSAEADVETKSLLGLQSVRWPTPDASPDRGSNSRYIHGDQKAGRMLKQETQSWPTPTPWLQEESPESFDARREREKEKGRNGNGMGEPLDMAASRFSRPAQPTLDGPICWCGTPNCDQPSHKRKLNPLFAGWLMGWPTWWCTKEPMPSARSEMELYLYRLRSQLSRLLAAQGF